MAQRTAEFAVIDEQCMKREAEEKRKSLAAATADTKSFDCCLAHQRTGRIGLNASDGWVSVAGGVHHNSNTNRRRDEAERTYVNFYWNFTWQNPINLCCESQPETRWRNINIILCDSSISRISISIMQQQVAESETKGFPFIEYTYRTFATRNEITRSSRRAFLMSVFRCCC